MYPGTHNLVDNDFFDKELNLRYVINDRDMVRNPIFYGGLPLWQLVQRKGMKSASYFWVGSATPIANGYPNYWLNYDGRIPNEKRIEDVLNWLKLPKNKRPRYIDLYFSFTDKIGHDFGPNSIKTKDAVLEADRLLGRIMNGLKEIDLDVNVILVSDHGMKEIMPKPENVLLEEAIVSEIDLDKVMYINNGTHMHFYFKDPLYKEELLQILNKKSGWVNHITLYEKEKIPYQWHYKDNIKVGDLFLTVAPGYYIYTEEKRQKILNENHAVGVHGYDPYKEIDMHGIFYANGPQIAKGKTVASFENIHIYPFIAQLLGIKEYPEIDGKKEILGSYLKK